MTKRIDFDEIREEPIEGKFNGKWYKLPADIPIEALAALESAEEGDDALNQYSVVREQVTKLFQVYQPEMKSPPCGLQELNRVIPRLYFVQPEAKPTKPTDPTGSRKRKSSQRRKATPSRS